MYAIWRAFAPSSADQPPTVTMATSPAEPRSRSSTTALVALLDAFSRFGCSMMTFGSRSAIPARTIHSCAITRVGCVHAGVAELVDAPGLGPGGESRGGSSPSARILHVGQRRDQRLDYPGIELGARVEAQLRDRVGGRHCRPVHAVARHRLEGIGDRKDPR